MTAREMEKELIRLSSLWVKDRDAQARDAYIKLHATWMELDDRGGRHEEPDRAP